MMYRAWLLLFVVFLISCSGKKRVPDFVTEKIPANKVVVKGNMHRTNFDSSQYPATNSEIQKQLGDLMVSLGHFQQKKQRFQSK